MPSTVDFSVAMADFSGFSISTRCSSFRCARQKAPRRSAHPADKTALVRAPRRTRQAVAQQHVSAAAFATRETDNSRDFEAVNMFGARTRQAGAPAFELLAVRLALADEAGRRSSIHARRPKHRSALSLIHL